MTAFDPTQASPDFHNIGESAVTAWQQALARLNFQKNTVMDKYGFSHAGDLTQGGVSYNGAHNASGVNTTGGVSNVGDFSQFAGLDNLTGSGGFRDELMAENNALNAADNRPDRGFTGGLSNQAKAAAQMAVKRSQQNFTTGYNTFGSGINQAGADAGNTTNLALGTNNADQAQYAGSEGLWRATLPVEQTYVAGISGGGTTPTGFNPYHIAQANGKALQVNQKQLAAQRPVTFGKSGSSAGSRGGHASRVLK